MDQAIDRQRFEENLRRYYQAEELTADEVARLHRAWLGHAADEAAVRGLRRLFELRNARPVHSLAWWEEHWQTESSFEAVRRIRPLDEVNMFLSTRVEPSPVLRPRRHRPARVAGHWSYDGWTTSYLSAFQAAEVERRWELRKDGQVRAPDDPLRDGACWAAHEAGQLELWFFRPGQPCRDVVCAVQPGDDVLVLRNADQIDLRTRWRRIRPE